MNRLAKWSLGLASIATMGFTALAAHAAADPALVNAAGDFTTSAKENVTGAVLSSTVLTGLAVMFGVLLVIFIIMRIIKRAAK